MIDFSEHAKKLILILALVILAGAGWLYYSYRKNKELSCVTRAEEKIVSGNSLSGVLDDGDSVTILFDYYKCNPIKIGDVVAYKHPAFKDHIIKIVRALPGDSFRLEQGEDGTKILVNDKLVKIKGGDPYLLDDRGTRLLKLYEKDYKERIPEETYLILGNSLDSLDSSRFGFISIANIAGKVKTKTQFW